MSLSDMFEKHLKQALDNQGKPEKDLDKRIAASREAMNKSEAKSRTMDFLHHAIKNFQEAMEQAGNKESVVRLKNKYLKPDQSDGLSIIFLESLDFLHSFATNNQNIASQKMDGILRNSSIVASNENDFQIKADICNAITSFLFIGYIFLRNNNIIPTNENTQKQVGEICQTLKDRFIKELSKVAN
jgi:hypothetical protein